MNKKANKKAFFVCALIGLMYVSVAMKLPDRFSMQRAGEIQRPIPQSVSIVIPKPAPIDTAIKANIYKDEPAIEPSYFVTIPIVCSAIRDGLIEKEGLVFIRVSTQNKAYCKKPSDILRDRDEEGLKTMAKIIGKKYMTAFFKKEGVALRNELDPQDVILGKGYSVEKNIILAMFDKNVPEEYNKLFPYVVHSTEIKRGRDSFEFANSPDTKQISHVKDNSEWIVPNLVNLPLRTALEKLSGYTSKIKINGTGIVTEQQPKPFEQVKGETECIIQGKEGRP